MQKLIENDPELLALWRESITEKPGRPLKQEFNDSITTIKQRERGKAYTVNRLRNDYPEIFERVKAGG